MNYAEFYQGLLLFNVAFGGGGGGGGTVTNVGTGTGLTGGPITTTGVVSLASIAAGSLLANTTVGAAAPVATTPSALLDNAFGNTRGNILFRGSTGWQSLAPSSDSSYFLKSGGVGADVAWAAPTVTLFNPAFTLYFGPGGDDTDGDGTENNPFETLAKVTTVGQALIVGGADFVQIIGLGRGVDITNVSITESGLDIYAPGIQHDPTMGDAFTVDLSGAGSASYINVLLASSAVEVGAKVLNLIGTFGGNDSVAAFTYIGAATGDVYLNVRCDFSTTFIGGLLTANAPNTKVFTQYGIATQTQATRLNLIGMLFGAGGGAIHGPVTCTNNWRYPMRRTVTLSGNYTLLTGDSGLLFVNDGSGDYTITLPEVSNQGTPPFNEGYEAEFLNTGSGSISFAVEGTDTFLGIATLDAPGQRATVIEPEAGQWVASLQNNTAGGGGGGGLTTNTVSSTSQAAAVNNRYICANAAQTTVTLPTTFAVGDVIVINGLGAAGFIAQCGTGTKIATVDDSVSVGGSLTSANSTDSLTLSGLVANSIWAIESIVTTGMTSA